MARFVSRLVGIERAEMFIHVVLPSSAVAGQQNCAQRMVREGDGCAGAGGRAVEKGCSQLPGGVALEQGEPYPSWRSNTRRVSIIFAGSSTIPWASSSMMSITRRFCSTVPCLA